MATFIGCNLLEAEQQVDTMFKMCVQKWNVWMIIVLAKQPNISLTFFNVKMLACIIKDLLTQFNQINY